MYGPETVRERANLYVFLIYCVLYILVGCKHRASEGVFYIGGRGCVWCQFIEPVTFALRNIALGGYLDTRRNIKNIYGTTYGLKYIYICIYIYIYIDR